MDASLLRRLAEVGLRELPPEALAGLVEWCSDHADNTGDARFSAIGRALAPIAALFDERNEAGGVPTLLVGHLESIIQRDLPSVLAARSAQDGSMLGRAMRDEIGLALETWRHGQ